MPTEIKGQPSSKEIIEQLAEEGKPVILSFSCGRDSIACWIALKEAGIEVVPVHMEAIPDLQLVSDELDYFEDYFQTRIIRVTHPGFYRMLDARVYQPPERLPILEAANLPVPTFDQTIEAVREDYGLADSWNADGVRASETLMRRMSMTRHGIFRKSTHKVSPIADWLKGEVTEFLDAHEIKYPIDYKLWGKSFDGIDLKFMKKMKEELPDDYEQVKFWFPLVDIDLERAEKYGL